MDANDYARWERSQTRLECKVVSTWADGYGQWHASVTLLGSRNREALAARKAIRDELRARDVSDAYVLKVTRERVTSHGTVIYGEV